MSNLDSMFHPRSVAVVGASPQPLAPSNLHFMYPLLMYGYPGKIYPVHPRADQIHGLPAYRSIRDIPGPVDYVISAIPAAQVPHLMLDCVAAGVKTVTVFTSGFSEVGTPAGARLEEEIAGIFRSEQAAHGIQVDFEKAGVPVFRSVDGAARAVARLIADSEARRGTAPPPRPRYGIN